jgi:methyltransferase (TIGR00027 family)
VRENRHSATAQRVAERRAAHQLFDQPRVFEDPLALSIIGAEATASLVSEPAKAQTHVSRALRAFIAVRSCYAEDNLAEAVRRGVTQYVVLGAGLDTFAYRNPFAELRVFEVDHPATQSWKRARLEAAGISIPEHLTFTPVDFERQTFEEGLKLAGFDFERPAFFSWLGVTPYLPREIVLATFERISAMSPENGVAFDYAIPRSSLGALEKMAFDAIASRVAAAGEPFISFFNTAELIEELRRINFRHIETLDSEKINARYFKDRADGLRIGGGLARLMCARG